MVDLEEEALESNRVQVVVGQVEDLAGAIHLDALAEVDQMDLVEYDQALVARL